MGGIGMLAAGVLGNPLLGNIQDQEVSKILRTEHPAIHQQVIGESKLSLFGSYQPVDQIRLDAANRETQDTVISVKVGAKSSALRTVVIFPSLMLVSYIALLLYFRSRGGYQPVKLSVGKVVPGSDSML